MKHTYHCTGRAYLPAYAPGAERFGGTHYHRTLAAAEKCCGAEHRRRAKAVSRRRAWENSDALDCA